MTTWMWLAVAGPFVAGELVALRFHPQRSAWHRISQHRSARAASAAWLVYATSTSYADDHDFAGGLVIGLLGATLVGYAVAATARLLASRRRHER